MSNITYLTVNLAELDIHSSLNRKYRKSHKGIVHNEMVDELANRKYCYTF